MVPENASIRRKNRIFAVQFMYSWSINRSRDAMTPEQLVDAFAGTYFPEQSDEYKFGRELAAGTVENIDAVDDLIKEYATNWTLDRIAIVDLAILRVAIYEMLFRSDVPPIVSINEAVDIGKILSTDDSGKFINGVLDGVKGRLSRPLRTTGI
jgi:N utilization substance protein B